MAGGWRAMTRGDGKAEGENYGIGIASSIQDTIDTLQECYGMIWYLAERLADHQDTSERPAILAVIEEARQHAETGRQRGISGR